MEPRIFTDRSMVVFAYGESGLLGDAECEAEARGAGGASPRRPRRPGRRRGGDGGLCSVQRTGALVRGNRRRKETYPTRTGHLSARTGASRSAPLGGASDAQAKRSGYAQGAGGAPPRRRQAVDGDRTSRRAKGSAQRTANVVLRLSEFFRWLSEFFRGNSEVFAHACAGAGEAPGGELARDAAVEVAPPNAGRRR